MTFDKNGDYIIVCRSEKEVKLILENFNNIMCSSPGTIWSDAGHRPVGLRMTKKLIRCKDLFSWYEIHAREFPTYEFIEAKTVLHHKIIRRV